MHIYRLCLFLGYIVSAFRILIGAEGTLATSDSFSFTEYNEGNLVVIEISCNLFLRRIITIFLKTCSQPTDALRFNPFTEDIFDQNSERLFCVTSCKLQVDDLKFVNVTPNYVYGLFSISKNKLKGYVNITSSEICPLSCTIFIDTVKQQQVHHSINNPLHSATTCHQLNATYSLPTFLLNSTLFKSDSNISYNVQKANRVISNNSLYYPVNFESLDFYNNIFRRTKRSSASIEKSSTFDTVRVVHRPSESQPYVLELFMIVDEILVAEFRGQYLQLVSRINMIMAHVNKLFAPFNIVIVIVRLEIWEQDRVSLKVEEHHLLTALAQFKRMYANVRHDCLHALLGTKEQGSRTRGKANHMTMCIYSRCVGYSRVSPTFDIVETARTMAHELGHNFGLRHDTEECECQGCIMATGVEFGTTVMKWSPCSIRDLPSLLNHGMGVCLHDLPVSGSVIITSFISNSKIPTSRENHNNVTIPSVVHIYDWQSETKRIPVSRLLTIRQRHSASSVEKYINGLCGNGILDPGEECDCGTQTSCPEKWQACCDPVRCRLRGNSECAGGPCCDIIINTDLQHNINQSAVYCKLKSSGTICRNESGTCDLPEFCDGHSQWCPADVYKIDGELCYTDEGHRAHCVRGGCREADGWCRVLWGKTGKRADKQCFYENEVWDRKSIVDSVANCGIQRPLPRDRWEDVKTWTGIPCQTWHDTSCGRLWCHHQNEKAMLLGWIQSQTRVIHSSGRSCSALVYDPVWPASDPATWDENKSLQINANGAGVGLYSANTQDAGMVPDGTPCSRGFCYNGSCKSVDDIRPRYSCYCNRHGTCNNLGHCHCLPGYKPPYCDEAGNGGSIDSGPPPKTDIKDNTLLIVICMLFFVILPLMGFGIYYVFIRSGRCLLSTSKEFIYTSSGLRKPCDENCTECFCQLFRHGKARTCSKQSSDRLKKPYPLLAFTADAQLTTNRKCISDQTNGYCNIISNGKLPNGFYKSIKPNAKVNFEPTLSNKTTREYCAQNTVSTDSSTENRTATTATEANKYLRRGPRAAITSLTSRNDKNGIRQQDSKVIAPINHLKYAKTDSENVCSKLNQQQNLSLSNCTSIKSTTFISEPRLEAMTYEGPMCSLNDAVVMNTLRRKSKGTLPLNQSTRSTFTTDSQSPPPINIHNPIINQQPVTLGRQPLSSKDISKPLLQATTYNERLSDLESARIRLAQREFEI